MVKKILTQDISKMCEVHQIRADGKVVLSGEVYEIYEVFPINIMTDELTNGKEIFDIYVSRLRNVSNNIKIYITKRPESFNEEIALYKSKLLEVEEEGLKLAICRYIEYLEGIDKSRDVYSTCYYIITKVDEESKDFQTLLSELKQFGLIVQRVTSKGVLEEVFKGAAQ